MAGASRILRKDAEGLRDAAVTLCEMREASDGSRTFGVTTVRTSPVDGHDFVPLIAFDGGPPPAGCDISSSTRLFVLVAGTWWEGRNVGCGRDS
ncbi:hypothetical protein GCM10009867_26610 [Pedococcus aerophilus]|uniref:Uncharacterized protein n=1 Tax=Pedococcus aerophilus TaxID=436356 RepID=A0ABP6H8S0_9MICO